VIAPLLCLLACPVCALQQQGGKGAAALVLLMIAVPYVVGVLVVRAVRNADR
jgi:hypothetical protein